MVDGGVNGCDMARTEEKVNRFRNGASESKNGVTRTLNGKLCCSLFMYEAVCFFSISGFHSHFVAVSVVNVSSPWILLLLLRSFPTAHSNSNCLSISMVLCAFVYFSNVHT